MVFSHVKSINHLLELIKPMIMKTNAVRILIPPDERLVVVARFLASGESLTSLSYYFKIGKAIVCGRAEGVCEAISKLKLKAVPTN